MLDPHVLNPICAALSLAVALGVLAVLGVRDTSTVASGRFTSVDGLRGYLAFGVFLHHTAYWYNFVRTGKWGDSSAGSDLQPHGLFMHLGPTSVVFFFMITGLLFYTKLLGPAPQQMDWLRLYVSRFLRLTPLYFCAVLATFVIVAIETGFSAREPWPILVERALGWLLFTMVGPQYPLLNAWPLTRLVTAGVTWSLRCEWLFYVALPILALTTKSKAPVRYVLLSLAVVVVLFLVGDPFHKRALLAFVGGIISALAVRQEPVRKFAMTRWGAPMAIGAVGAAVCLFQSAYDVGAEILLTLAFTIIAAGNTLFGILKRPLSRAFGDISYSIYLLHGIVLYVAIRFVVGTERTAGFSPAQYWALICTCGAVLIGISVLSFRYIEMPAMQRVSRWTAALRARFGTSQRAARSEPHVIVAAPERIDRSAP